MAGKNKTLQTIVDVAGSIDPSLKKAVNHAIDALESVNWKAAAAAAAAAGISVATGKAVMEAGKYLLDLGSKFDDVADTIRTGTGATGEALDGLLKDFDEVYKSVPSDMESVSQAISDFNTRLDLTGPALQEMSKQAIQVSDLLGDDLSTVIESSSQAIQQWSINSDDMSAAMDHVFKVSQSTGMGFTDLMKNVQSFGPQLQDMGYSFETATALIGQMEKAGVNTEEALAAMKKSVTTLAKDGISASDGIAMYYEAILNAESAADAAAIASEVFGSRAGSTMASAIRDGTMAAGDFAAQLAESGESISGVAEDTYDFAENLQLFKQNAEVALKPLANTVFDSINGLMPPLMESLDILIPIIADLTEEIIPLVSELFTGLMPGLRDIIPIVANLAKNLFSKLLPPIMKIISSVLPVVISLMTAITPLLDLVISLLGPILDGISALLGPILDVISTALAPLIETISNLIHMALEPLSWWIDFCAGLWTNVLGAAIEAIMPYIESVQAIFSGLIDFIANVFTGNWEGAWSAVKDIFVNIFDGIANAVKAPINFVISLINKFLSGLNGIKIPDWVPGVGGKGFEIPEIPMLAAGGFTQGISIAGEAAQEAVISFDPAYRQDNVSYWARAGQMLGVADYEDLSFLANSDGEVFIGEIVFAPQIQIDEKGDLDASYLMNLIMEYGEEFVDQLMEVIARRRAGQYAPVGGQF